MAQPETTAPPLPQLRVPERPARKEHEALFVGTIAGGIKTREQSTPAGPEVVQAHFLLAEEGSTEAVMVITKRGQAKSVKRRADQGYLAQGTPVWLSGYRHLDTAVLEALILEGVLGMTEESISHLEGLGYSRTDDEARELVLSREFDCAFFLRSSPVRQVQEIAAAGVNMPPKSTYFYPKVPTGLMFNPLA